MTDDAGNIVFYKDQNELALMPSEHIINDYVAKVKTGKHSLVLPLGARAKSVFVDTELKDLVGTYTLELIDISGATWRVSVTK